MLNLLSLMYSDGTKIYLVAFKRQSKALLSDIKEGFFLKDDDDFYINICIMLLPK